MSETTPVKLISAITCASAFVMSVVALAFVIASNAPEPQSSPLTVENGVTIVNPTGTTCIGGRTTCTTTRLAPNYIHAFVPIIINSHIIKQENDTIAFYYFNDSLDPDFVYDNIDAIAKPIAFFRRGGAAIGSSPYYMRDNAITLVKTPDPNPDIPINNAWLPSASIFFYNPIKNSTSSLTDVCHVQNASMCGSLFRTSPTDQGVYNSEERVVVKSVDYGLIMANMESHIIANNITIGTIVNNGMAVPCSPTPPYTDYLTTALYLEYYPAAGSSCINIIGPPLKEVVQLNTCLPTTAQPAIYALSTRAYVNIIAASAFIQYDTLVTVTVSFFTDPACATIIGTPLEYTLGCPSSPPQSYQWYYSSQ